MDKATMDVVFAEINSLSRTTKPAGDAWKILDDLKDRLIALQQNEELRRKIKREKDKRKLEEFYRLHVIDIEDF